MTTTIKLRSEKRGEHLHTTIFMGKKGQTLHNCGTLAFRMGEWQLFGAALTLGQDRMNRNDHKYLEVVTEWQSPDQEGKAEYSPVAYILADAILRQQEK